MSRRKIKRDKRIKTPKVVSVSPRGALIEQLMKSRAKERQTELETIEKLIAEDKLDPYKINDYTYLRTVAIDMEWSIGRLKRAIKNANVAEAVKAEAEE